MEGQGFNSPVDADRLWAHTPSPGSFTYLQMISWDDVMFALMYFAMFTMLRLSWDCRKISLKISIIVNLSWVWHKSDKIPTIDLRKSGPCVCGIIINAG